MTYDAAGRPTVQTNANLTVTTRAYSSRGFLTDIDTTGPAGVLQDLSYTLDAAGMATQVTSGVVAEESWSYVYDSFHRLTTATNLGSSAESQSFQYDTIGRLTYNSRIGSYNYPAAGAPRPHAPTQVGSDTLTYDANGNLESTPTATLTWGADNRLAQVGPVQFTYDGLGSRIKKETTGGSTSLYPMGDDYEITDGVVIKYVSAGALGVVAKRVGSMTYWLHTDRLGSIQRTSDANGAEWQRRTFRPYGQTLNEAGAQESRGWIGQRLDPETGLTYLHARYYTSSLGVFVSPDPIGVAGGLNSYGYGHGNPTNLTDPGGLFSCPPDADWCAGVTCTGGSVNFGSNCSYDFRFPLLNEAGRWLSGLFGRGEVTHIPVTGAGRGATPSTASASGPPPGALPPGWTRPGAPSTVPGTGGASGGTQGPPVVVPEHTPTPQPTPQPTPLPETAGDGSSLGGAIANVSGKVWAAPTSAVGLVAAWPACCLAGSTTGFDNNAFEVYDHPLIPEGAALTLGNVILYGPKADPLVLGSYHEEPHTRQAEVLGPAYLPLHIQGQLLSYLLTCPTGRCEYDKYNWLEYGPNRGRPWPWH